MNATKMFSFLSLQRMRDSNMADVVDDHENSLKKDDFMDPLGAKDPLGCAGDDDDNGVEFDVCFSAIFVIYTRKYTR